MLFWLPHGHVFSFKRCVSIMTSVDELLLVDTNVRSPAIIFAQLLILFIPEFITCAGRSTGFKSDTSPMKATSRGYAMDALWTWRIAGAPPSAQLSINRLEKIGKAFRCFLKTSKPFEKDKFDNYISTSYPLVSPHRCRFMAQLVYTKMHPSTSVISSQLSIAPEAGFVLAAQLGKQPPFGQMVRIGYCHCDSARGPHFWKANFVASPLLSHVAAHTTHLNSREPNKFFLRTSKEVNASLISSSP